MKHLIRTKLAKDIICEVSLPTRQQGKIALVCSGAPASPSKKEVVNFLASKGYVAIALRYRGTWESGGSFLMKSPAKDVEDVIEDLIKSKSIRNILTKENIPLKIKSFYLFGVSFGGPAVLLNSKHSKVQKVFAIAPVINWNNKDVHDPFEEFVRFSEEGFGGAYRVKNEKDWQKLLQKDFYNPLTMINKIDSPKCFIIQAMDDDVCPTRNVKKLESLIPISVYYKPKGGHLGTMNITQKFFWKKIENFLKK